MKTIILLTTCLFAASSFASSNLNAASEADVCKQYGHDLGWNIKTAHADFMKQVVDRTQNGTWSISTQECAELTQKEKYNAYYEVEELLNDD
ncbi:MAG: hypothetical protein ACPHV3_09980 [Vibrio sp.]